MTELGTRSRSQILRTFLPQQTADLRGGIYRVDEWTAAVPVHIETETLRRRLLRELAPWEAKSNDSGYAADLRRGTSLEVVELDERRGVTVSRFPQVWLCPSCKRIGRDRLAPCRCGSRHWGQLHFLGFHECGSVQEPWIPRCPAHDDVKLVSPRSASAADIRFVCPTCNRELMRGLGYNRECAGCGQRGVHWNVHKARSVYAPRGTVLVNPPRPERLRDLEAVGGARRALAWVVDGLTAATPAAMHTKPTRGQFIDQLVSQNHLSRDLAEKLAASAAEARELADDTGDDRLDGLSDLRRHEAEHEALDIAMSMAESRVTLADLTATAPNQHLADRYQTAYPGALHEAGLAAIDLADKFPVLSVMYGYTRGGGDPTEARLVPFRGRRTGYRLHGDFSETEALFVRLDPARVARWLLRRGHALPGWAPTIDDPVAARVAILQAAVLPDALHPAKTPSVGGDLLTLVHTYAHRFIRQTAVYAGIDRDALSEYLVPLNLGFFVYATPRGDFVLGGMQAVFETELDALVDASRLAEHRCPLDPGCSRGTGACSACLHLGEPSCRLFNTHLDRRALFGAAGFLSHHTET